MTIANPSNGAIAYGTTNATPAYPTGIAAGDLLLLVAGAKPAAAGGISWSSFGSWRIAQQRGNAGGYGTTLAADTGNTYSIIYQALADGTESGTVTLTPGGTSGSDCVWAFIMRWTKTKGVWELAGSSGSDSSAGNLSFPFDTDPGLTAGDQVLCAFSDPTNANNGANLSGSTLTCTGVTFGTVTEVAEPCTSLGNNVAGLVVTAPVNSGSSNGNVTTLAATAVTGTNVRGPCSMLRLRENVALSSGLVPFTGMSHHHEPHDELATRRPSGLYVPRRRQLVTGRAA